MYLGVDWYPDQWGMDQVEEDLDGIVGLGANIVRIADFAWHIFEPYDGHYDFSFFDEVIRRIKERGLKILFCIPTATMPPWLEKKYPQISIMDEQGHRLPYGARRAYCVNSSIYRKKAADLTRELIIHYRDEDAIVAWQVDNEIGHENSDICFCEECHSKFTNYLKRKYPSIDDLNKRWGTDFWSHHYDSFREIPIPKKALVAQNPSLRLEWERFRSLSIKSFLDLEKDVIKAVKPDALVLHDFSGGTMDKHYDPFDAAKDLDAIAYNNYPVWGGMPEALPNYATAFNLDHARGMKRKNFWITEEIMGAQGHDVIGAAPKPDQGIVWALQAMAHGCENLLFFRYRGFTKGAEQYCFGILDSDNRKKRKYEEVKRFFAEAKKYEDAFTSPIHNDAVLLYDYDSAASFRHQQQSSQFGFTAEMQKLYEELWKRGIGTDICASDIDLDEYRLVVLPHMIVMDETFKTKLKDYVRKGGTLVLTARSAWKDRDNNLFFGKVLPADLTDLIGGTLEEQESVLADQFREVTDEEGNVYWSGVFMEMLESTGADVLYRWKDCAFGDYAAVLKNRYGEGTVYYLGTSLKEEGLYRLFEDITKTAELSGIPNGSTETVVRRGKEGVYTISLDFEHYTWNIRKEDA